MAINAGFRMAYGVGGLFSPALMAKLRAAPDTPERPDARLFVRGFSAHQIAVAALGLASLRWRRLERAALLAAVAIDAADMVSAVVEADKRSGLESDLAGGLLFSAAGIASAGAGGAHGRRR
jgi:predicted cobalt transporter CbtA